MKPVGRGICQLRRDIAPNDLAERASALVSETREHAHKAGDLLGIECPFPLDELRRASVPEVLVEDSPTHRSIVDC